MYSTIFRFREVDLVNFILHVVLLVVLIAPMAVLIRNENKLHWRTRYVLAAAPGAYCGLGWILATIGYGYFGCQGGLKHLHSCFAGTHDLTFLIGYGNFLMIVFYIGGPLSLWLIFDTALKQLGKWHLQHKSDDS